MFSPRFHCCCLLLGIERVLLLLLPLLPLLLLLVRVGLLLARKRVLPGHRTAGSFPAKGCRHMNKARRCLGSSKPGHRLDGCSSAAAQGIIRLRQLVSGGGSKAPMFFQQALELESSDWWFQRGGGNQGCC